LIYLLCELKARDLPGRAAVARVLLARGYPVVIGQIWSVLLNNKDAPPGCYVFCTANRYQANNMGTCRASGHRIVAMDEESTPLAGERKLTNLVPAAFENCDTFIAQTEEHRMLLARAFPAAAGKIVVGGSPRFAALRYGKPARPMPEPYILINTGLGLINSVWRDRDKAAAIALDAMGIVPNSPAGTAEMRERVQVEEAVLRELTGLIGRLSTLQTHKVVVRPHPSEDAGLWKRTLGVQVVEGSDPLPWISHADVMIHSDSTTGLEAAMLGVPCVNLSPNPAWSARFIMQRANVTVRDAESAFHKVSGLLREGIHLEGHATEITVPDAAARVAGIIAEGQGAPARLGRWGWNQWPRADAQRRKFTASGDEVAAIVGRKVSAQLDDSLFLFDPGVS
jgi:surface carbohydrate biosynthesis protein